MMTMDVVVTPMTVDGAILDRELARARQFHPEWYSVFDDCCFGTRPPEPETAAMLITTAPTPFLAGLIAGYWLAAY